MLQDKKAGELLIHHLNDPSKQEVHLSKSLGMLDFIRQTQDEMQNSSQGTAMSNQQKQHLMDKLAQVENRAQKIYTHLVR